MLAYETARSFVRGRALATLLVVLAVCQGCVLYVYSPLGNDATVEGSWTINGVAPTAVSCADLGIDTVRIAFYDGGSAFYYDTLDAPCTSGRIDTRPRAILASGTYRVRFEAFRGGDRVAEGNMQTIRATVGGHVVLAPADFIAGGGFDPRGTDATMSGSWTVMGAAPTAASCNALGVDVVRLAFYDGASARYYDAFDSPCANGSIDTRPTPVLRAGTYTVRFEAFRGSDRVGEGAMQTVLASAGGHVTIMPADFVSGGSTDPRGSDATLSLDFTLNGRAPTVDTCFAVGVDAVRVLFHPPSDVAMSAGIPVAQVPCAMGRIDTRPMPVIRAGSWRISVQTVGVSGTVVDDLPQTTEPLTVPAGSHVMLNPVDVDYGTVLTIGLDWSLPTGMPSDCSGAGVSRMSWTLLREGSPVANGNDEPCTEVISFDMSGGLGGGTYSFYFEGFDGGGVKRWRVPSSMCTGIAVSNGAIAYDQCIAEYGSF